MPSVVFSCSHHNRCPNSLYSSPTHHRRTIVSSGPSIVAGLPSKTPLHHRRPIGPCCCCTALDMLVSAAPVKLVLWGKQVRILFPLFWLALASPAAVANLVQVDNCCEIDAIKKFFQDFPGKDALITDNCLVGIWGIGDYCDSMDQKQQRRLA